MSVQAEPLETRREAGDLERLAAAIARFRAGEISEAELRAIRVPLGVYEERGEGSYMIRVRAVAATLAATELRALAAAARRFGRGRSG